MESGQNEVYVRPIPDVQSGKWQISTGGGSRPAWAPNGRELFYLGGNSDGVAAMMSVPVQTTPTLIAGNPSKLFEGEWYTAQNGRNYDLARDGQRFLMIKTGAASIADREQAPSTITVVVNWAKELKARLPIGK